MNRYHQCPVCGGNIYSGTHEFSIPSEPQKTEEGAPFVVFRVTCAESNGRLSDTERGRLFGIRWQQGGT